MVFLYALFILSTILTVFSAGFIMYTKNIIHSCVYLLGCLVGIAGLYVTLGADFIAAVQILVYVGGVVVLMLFAVMLTGGQDFIKHKFGQHLIPTMGNKKSFTVGTMTALVLGFTLVRLIFYSAQNIDANKPYPYESTVERIGTLLVTDHVISFEVISILLLGALVGAAIIARPLYELKKIEKAEKVDEK